MEGMGLVMSNLKNMIVLKDLPSNLIEEAIIILKENKKIHKYQMAENKKETELAKVGKTNPNDSNYIIKEAEMLVNNYTEKLEKKSPNIKRLEKKYKSSVKINFFLLFTTILGIIFSLI